MRRIGGDFRRSHRAVRPPAGSTGRVDFRPEIDSRVLPFRFTLPTSGGLDRGVDSFLRVCFCVDLLFRVLAGDGKALDKLDKLDICGTCPLFVQRG